MKLHYIVMALFVIGLVFMTACNSEPQMNNDSEDFSDENTVSDEEVDTILQDSADTGLEEDEEFIELGDMI